MNKQKILSGELFTLKNSYDPIECKINSESVNENELKNIFMSAEENPLKALFDRLFTSNQLIIESTNPYDYGKLIATHSSIKEMTDEAKIQKFLNIFVSKIEDQIKNANPTDLDPGENTMKNSEVQDANRFFNFVLNNEEVSNSPECPVCRELMVGGENNRFTFCFDEETICDISREQFQTSKEKTSHTPDTKVFWDILKKDIQKRNINNKEEAVKQLGKFLHNKNHLTFAPNKGFAAPCGNTHQHYSVSVDSKSGKMTVRQEFNKVKEHNGQLVATYLGVGFACDKKNKTPLQSVLERMWKETSLKVEKTYTGIEGKMCDLSWLSFNQEIGFDSPGKSS